MRNVSLTSISWMAKQNSINLSPWCCSLSEIKLRMAASDVFEKNAKLSAALTCGQVAAGSLRIYTQYQVAAPMMKTQC